MKKLLILVLMITVFMVFSLNVQAQDSKHFEIEGYTVYQLEKDRCPVYLYYDIIGYKDKEQKQPIKQYVASCNLYEVGTTVQVVTQNHFRDYYVISNNGILDTSWHNYK